MHSKAYKYFAFISYSSDDLKEAWNLKKKLDSYKLPTVLCRQYEKERKPTHEAFLDKTNIRPGDLTDELRANLDNSHYLVVVCSPRSAISEYVKSEIEWFTRNGREDQMFLFIIDSKSSQIENCFNPAIKNVETRWSLRDGEKREILGVNIKEKNVDQMFAVYRLPIIGACLQRERAYMQLISRLLNLEFKQLWSYQRIRLWERVLAWLIGILLVIGLISYASYINRPVDVCVELNDKSTFNQHLPPLKDAVLTLNLDNKIEIDTIQAINNIAVFRDISHKYLGKKVKVTVTCLNYLCLDTNIILSKMNILNIQRDPNVFGKVQFRIWNPDKEIFVDNTEIEIAGKKLMSDANGLISITVPLEYQKQEYSISSSIPLARDTIYMPCGPDDIIETK